MARMGPPLIRAPVLGINPLPAPAPQIVIPRLAVPCMAGIPPLNPQPAPVNLQQRMETQAELNLQAQQGAAGGGNTSWAR